MPYRKAGTRPFKLRRGDLREYGSCTKRASSGLQGCCRIRSVLRHLTCDGRAPDGVALPPMHSPNCQVAVPPDIAEKADQCRERTVGVGSPESAVVCDGTDGGKYACPAMTVAAVRELFARRLSWTLILVTECWTITESMVDVAMAVPTSRARLRRGWTSRQLRPGIGASEEDRQHYSPSARRSGSA